MKLTMRFWRKENLFIKVYHLSVAISSFVWRALLDEAFLV